MCGRKMGEVRGRASNEWTKDSLRVGVTHELSSLSFLYSTLNRIYGLFNGLHIVLGREPPTHSPRLIGGLNALTVLRDSSVGHQRDDLGNVHVGVLKRSHHAVHTRGWIPPRVCGRYDVAGRGALCHVDGQEPTYELSRCVSSIEYLEKYVPIFDAEHWVRLRTPLVRCAARLCDRGHTTEPHISEYSLYARGVRSRGGEPMRCGGCWTRSTPPLPTWLPTPTTGPALSGHPALQLWDAIGVRLAGVFNWQGVVAKVDQLPRRVWRPRERGSAADVGPCVSPPPFLLFVLAHRTGVSPWRGPL